MFRPPASNETSALGVTAADAALAWSSTWWDKQQQSASTGSLELNAEARQLEALCMLCAPSATLRMMMTREGVVDFASILGDASDIGVVF